MSVKTEVLKLLETNRDRDLSGQDIADRLGVTRAAVWKAVKALKQQGYRVDAANNGNGKSASVRVWTPPIRR